MPSKTFDKKGRSGLIQPYPKYTSQHTPLTHTSFSPLSILVIAVPPLPISVFYECLEFKGHLLNEAHLLSLGLLQASSVSRVRGLAVLTLCTTHSLAVEVFGLNLLLSNITSDSTKFFFQHIFVLDMSRFPGIKTQGRGRWVRRQVLGGNLLKLSKSTCMFYFSYTYVTVSSRPQPVCLPVRHICCLENRW